uniref:Ovule protein n=1 Tax=Steinernema glaseri TaxID=37863 RepID=A0A1I7YKG3_9BILA
MPTKNILMICPRNDVSPCNYEILQPPTTLEHDVQRYFPFFALTSFTYRVERRSVPADLMTTVPRGHRRGLLKKSCSKGYDIMGLLGTSGMSNITSTL